MSQPLDLKQLARQGNKPDAWEPLRANALRGWIASHGYRHKDLARLIGVSPSMFAKIMSGVRAPKERLDKLVALGVPREYLPLPTSGKVGRPRVKEQEEPVRPGEKQGAKGGPEMS